MSTRQRPLSPHVQIYKFPIAAVSSVTNRITGVALSAAVTTGGVLAASGVEVVDVINSVNESYPYVISLTKFALTYPFVYHYLGGLRHYYWDYTNRGLGSTEEVTKSSYALFGASFVIGTYIVGAVSL